MGIVNTTPDSFSDGGKFNTPIKAIDFAYDLLDKIYGDICCSDADYGNIIYYDIIEDKKKEKNR